MTAAATPQPAATAPESATRALYRAALGPVNTARYLEVFERFDEAGRASPAWNAAAGWLTLNWMVFRRLWVAALVYLACAAGLALLLVALGRHFLQWPRSVEWGVLGALGLLSIAIPGAYGNAVLHADIRRRMTRAVSEARTVREACATLEQQASSRKRLWALVVLNVLLVAAAVGSHQALEPRGRAPAADLARTPPAVGAAVEPPAPAPAPETASASGSGSGSELDPAPVPEAALPAASAQQVVSEPMPGPGAVGESAPALPLPAAEAGAAVSAPATPPPAPPPVLAPRPAKTADTLPQAHGINVGLFADRANAERARARLVEAGFPAILQDVDHPKGPLTRVRVGPFANRAQADEAAARIRAMGLDAVVFRP